MPITAKQSIQVGQIRNIMYLNELFLPYDTLAQNFINLYYKKYYSFRAFETST